jgi:hypothetical protein
MVIGEIMKSLLLACFITILLNSVACNNPATPTAIVKPTEACPPGSSYIPDQGCTAPVEIVTVEATPVVKNIPTVTPTPIRHPQFKLEGPRPLIVWLENDPWRMVIGSDSPTFALYEEGQLIYLKEDETGEPGYFFVTLTETEKSQFLEMLAIDPQFFTLERYYEATEWTDQPNHTLLVSDHGPLKRVDVYGDVRGEAEVKQKTPRPFLELVEKLSRYDHPQATLWLPKEVEIMVWPYNSSEALPWPADWPDLEHPTTWYRGNDSYSLYLAWPQFEQFREMIEQESPSALLINDKTWTYGYRYPFLNEHLWLPKARLTASEIPIPTPTP